MNPLVFGTGERLETPLDVALFPKKLPVLPRCQIERVFDVHRWERIARGSHFAALEQPELLAEEIRAFFKPLRSGIC
ncbi:hypothetical protein NRB15_03080 [Pseudomonas alliivorans]|uniref:alpha/beta fold hydrolase n=1 Tax=Pseudomonas alliivorans TaxID=2810613 RepID=UPI00211D0DF7|nr:hypothetical protein [Pseudomonas alliivorans]MCQ9469317.1 hypothetical protein [Pseudomonas alliivorans]